MSPDSEKEYLTSLYELHQRRLRILEQQDAREGRSTPPEIMIEIEDIREKMIELDKRLGGKPPHSHLPTTSIAKSLILGFLLLLIGVGIWNWSGKSPDYSIEVSGLDRSSLSPLPSVQITSLTFSAPHIISARGIFSDIPENQGIWTYVLATNNRYYFKNARKNSDGTWVTLEGMGIGDRNKSGGEYEIGIALAEVGTCIDPNNTNGYNPWPPCATSISQVTVKRIR